MTSEDTQLSKRELDVLRILPSGASNKEIAGQLNISEATVKIHLKNIYRKTGSASRTEAAFYAVRTGLVQVAGGTPPVAVEDEPPEAATGLLETVVPPDATVVTEDLQPVVDMPPAPTPSKRRYWLVGGAALALLVLGALIYGLRAGLLSSAQPTANPTDSTAVTSGQPAPEQRWRERAPMPQARAGFGLASYSYDGRTYLYAIAGAGPDGPSAQVQRYDPAADVWVPFTAKSTAVTDVQAAVIGNRIFIPGGQTAKGVSNVLEAYDPRRDQWSTLAPLPEPRSGYALAAVEGKLYLFGGWDGARYRADVWRYDPDTGAWSERRAMPTARAYAGAVVIDGQVYVVGGADESGALRVNERYIPADEDAGSNPWSTKAPLPVAVSHLAVAAASNLAFVVGGADGAGRQLIYNAALDAWEVQTAPLGALQDLRAQALANKLHFMGGFDGANYSAATYEYLALWVSFLPVAPASK